MYPILVKQLIYKEIQSTIQAINNSKCDYNDLVILLAIYTLVIRGYNLADVTESITKFYYETESLNKLLT